LHAAAAGYRRNIAGALIDAGADVNAENRRGATPLHYAADGGPVFKSWNPDAQAEIITFLIQKGANPNAVDKSGVAPLHRAVRQRCPMAVDALLRNGADMRLKNKSGSTPLHLAVQNTGRGGTGAPEAKALQRQIIALLLTAGANPLDRDGRGKTIRQCAQSDWIRDLF
jgi:ankyrin repeat protein